MKINKRLKFKKNKTTNYHNLSGLCQMIYEEVSMYLSKIREMGSLLVIKSELPEINFESLILKKIKHNFTEKSFVKLPKFFGAIKVFYEDDALKIEFYGLIRYLIKKININNSQILECFYNIFRQIDKEVAVNTNKLKLKLNKILFSINKNVKYESESENEVALYELILVIVSNYYDKKILTPEPLKHDISSHVTDLFLKNFSNLTHKASEKLKLNFKITYESKILKLLSKKKNHIKVNKILSLFNINIDELMNNLANKFMYKNFSSAFGEILHKLVDNYFEKFKCENLHRTQIEIPDYPFNITLTIGKKIDKSMNLCFFTKPHQKKCYLEISEHSDFSNSRRIKCPPNVVFRTFPIMNFGILAKYKVEKVLKYNIEISNLKPNIKYFYRIFTMANKKITYTRCYSFHTLSLNKNLKFLIFADSQGMVKSDYNVFQKVIKDAQKKINDTNLVIHLGDFVDDGNNEEYWSWLLNSDFWKNNFVIPVAGNHEKKICEIGQKFACENSIIGHFNLSNLPIQDTSSGVHYSFSYKDALFIIINTNDTDETGKINESQVDWILNTSKNSNAYWKILLTHKSPYSNGPHYGTRDFKQVGWQIKEIAYLANVDIVIGGHDHVYARTPILNLEKTVPCEHKFESHNCKIFDTYIKDFGTVFVIPGASGVKNYKQNTSAKIPIERVVSLDKPTFSEFEITKNRIYFSTYLCDFQNNKKEIVKLVDSFSIAKEKTIFTGKKLSEWITKLPDFPWLPQEKIFKKIDKKYKELNYCEKILVKNYNKLSDIISSRKNFKKIQNMKISIVDSRKKFIEALKDSLIGTIIASLPEIKFENKFGFKNFYEIKRNLCIRGNSSLKFVTFHIKKNTMLILDDGISIENARRHFSCYKPINAIEMEENSKLILRGSASFLVDFAHHRNSHAIKIFGNNCKIYIDAESDKIPCFPAECFISNDDNTYKYQVIWREKIQTFE